ncbi:MAG: ferredoxin family protein [Verrucomicrobiales bacterium]|nr:ferredoxin family protein [Verrucomicrobiales bacterium]
MKNEIHPVQVILFEGNGASAWENGHRVGVTANLLDRGYSVTRVTENADQAAFTDVSGDASVIVLGEFTDHTPEVVDAVGKRKIETRDTSGLDTEAVVTLVEETRAGLADGLNQPGQTGAWKPWFPVIDYDRCTNCMQCLSFCLFDVYGVDDDKQIQVQNNDNCKTNCPACSRVCPEVAIMFPKYKTGPINGEPVKQADVERESMKVDITSLLGGDIYSSLRTRSEKAKSRFSKERSPDKALNERKRCLTKLQQSGIIPAEVLAELDLESLPSPEEIQRKAKELAALQNGGE